MTDATETRLDKRIKRLEDEVFSDTAVWADPSVPTRLLEGSAGSPNFVTIPTTTLADTEYIAARYFVPSDKTLQLLGTGVQNDSEAAPTGLKAVFFDETNGQVIHSENSKYTTAEPIASVTGPLDVSFRTVNDTGGSQNASSWFQHKFE